MMARKLIPIGMASLMFLGPALARAGSERLSLKRAIEVALDKSPLLQAARHEVEAVEAGVGQARAGFLPKLDISESFTRADNPVFAFSSKLDEGRFTQADFEVDRLNRPGPENNFRTNLSLAQPIYTAGRASIGLQRARLSRDASARGFIRERQRVLFQVAKAYYGVLLAQENLEVIQSALRAAQANVELAQARFETGLVVESDLLSAKVRLASLRQQEIAAANQVTLAKAALNDAMGLPLEEEWIIADRLGQRPARHQEPEALPALALERRPDYERLSLEERAAQRGIALARAEFLPTLSATARYELNQLNFTSDGQDSWFVGVVFEWNLFNGLSDRAKVAEAGARLAQTRALRARRASAIKLEVKDAFLKHKTAKERIGVAQGAVVQAEESLRIVKDRYGAGLSTIVNLLASEAALTQARGNLALALYDYNVGLANLELALGTISKDSFQ